MTSDKIYVTSTGEGIEQALAQAEAVAAFKQLSQKDTLHLRLLTEEMMGMVQALTGTKKAEFWIEDADGTYRLHLKTKTPGMNMELREKLLSASSTGKNAAAKGVMGKIRDLFERAMEPLDDSAEGFYLTGWEYVGAEQSDMFMASAAIWSFNRYKQSLEDDAAHKEEWDMLEQSIVASLADEIQIGIRENTVEMVIYKKF